MTDDNEQVLDKNHFSIQYSIDNQIDDYKKIQDYGIDEYLSNLEKKMIEKTLKKNENNITRAAKELKNKCQILQHKIKKYVINL